jgi:hypothetical protein
VFNAMENNRKNLNCNIVETVMYISILNILVSPYCSVNCNLMSFAKAVFQTKIYLMSPATLAQVPPAPIPTLISHNIIVKMCDVFRI